MTQQVAYQSREGVLRAFLRPQVAAFAIEDKGRQSWRGVAGIAADAFRAIRVDSELSEVLGQRRRGDHEENSVETKLRVLRVGACRERSRRGVK
jgi:hypothetical protein